MPGSQRLVAAVLRGGADARATGWSACALCGLEGFDPATQPWVAIPPARRVRGIDDACRRGLIDRNRLLARSSELGMHRGAAAVRHLFSTGLLDQDGELERQLALALAAQDLRPAWGMEVLPGVIADACFPEASLVIECDGRRWHTIDSDRAADLSREGVLIADGGHVERVTASDLRDDVEVVRRIREVRASRIAARWGRAAGWRPVRPGRRIRPPR